MVTTHNLGFPRIGRKRELKFALETYWKKEISEQALLEAHEEDQEGDVPSLAGHHDE